MAYCRIPGFIVVVLLLFFSSTVFSNPTQIPETYEPDIKIIKGSIKRGSTASSLLNKYIPLRTIYQISNQAESVFSLRRIKNGQSYRIMVQDDELIEFEYEIDLDSRLLVQKDEDSFNISIEPIFYDVHLAHISATISYSLSGTIRKAGEKNELACKLADIFAWDIDFFRDIQPGDSFDVLVEKKYKEGRFRGYGDIQAAFFTNKGTVYKAFLHTDARGVSGYYDEDGNSMQKAFLKAPLSFSRISSKFSKKRLHPILKKVRPHNGVDYAAPIGTPIKTVGDGTIIRVGYDKGAGKYMKVRHPNGYTSSYFHMSRFAKGMKTNKKVIQGQTIGYVGSTGYSTGPHLDFRLCKSGRYIDPLNYKAPSAKPINQEEMEEFNERSVALSQRIVAAKGMAELKPKPST